jgi:hypothetical protein
MGVTDCKHCHVTSGDSRRKLSTSARAARYRANSCAFICGRPFAYLEAPRQDEPATLYVEEALLDVSICCVGGFSSARLSLGQALTDFLTKIVKHSSLPSFRAGRPIVPNAEFSGSENRCRSAAESHDLASVRLEPS